MYKAISYFVDLQDNNKAYKRGDVYPRYGYKPSKERVKELLTPKNKRGVPVIVEIKEISPSKAAETEKVDNVSTDFMNPPTEGNDEAVEQPKKRGRKKKDA